MLYHHPLLRLSDMLVKLQADKPVCSSQYCFCKHYIKGCLDLLQESQLLKDQGF